MPLTSTPRDDTTKEVHLGGGAYPATTPAAAGPNDKGTGSTAIAYRDNQSGAIYSDPTKCVNGCTQIVGDDADAALAKGYAPAPSRSEPRSAEEQAEDERKRGAEADAAAKTAAVAKDAEVKAVPAVRNKARRRAETKKR